MKNIQLLIFVLCTAGLSHSACAGVLELLNGDRLEGELVSIDEGHLLWRSVNFGEQKIKKSQVKDIQTPIALKINGNKDPCYLHTMDAEYLRYQCGESPSIKRASLLRIKTLVPYQDYKKGVYRHTGKINLWGAYARGNEVRDEWNLQTDVSIRRNDLRHVATGSFSRASWNNSPSQERWAAGYSLDWFFGEHWFWYNSLLAGADPQRGMHMFQRIGSGAGYQFFENKTITLSLSSGLAVVDEVYQLAPELMGEYDQDDHFMALELGLDFRYQLPWGVGFFHNNELLQSTQSDPTLQVKTATGLSSMILDKIYSELKVDYWLDTDPQPARQDRDTRMSVGVSYKW